jgi:hypothetical protein
LTLDSGTELMDATSRTGQPEEGAMKPTRRFGVRSRMCLAAFAVALAGGGHAAVASADGGPAPGVDLVAGAGLHRGSPEPGIEVEVAAVSGPFGEDPRGRLSVRTDDGAAAYSGRVTCLNVAGDTASIGIVVDQITADGPGAPPAVGVEQMYNLVDGGTPGSAGDFIQGYPFDWFPPTFCPFFGAIAHVERGNYVVQDATS